MMKKKRFYPRKDRDSRWTEPEVGRPIAFAGKYDKGDYADRTGNVDVPSTSAASDTVRDRAKREKRRLRLMITAVCVVLVCVGYIGADAMMQRHAKPLALFDAHREEPSHSAIETADIQIVAQSTDGLCLDGAVMLSAVIDETQKAGNTAVAFEAKRPAGTIGYTSSLSAVESFAAVSEAGTKPQASVEQLIANDLLPVACVCCYQDNVVPARSPDLAVTAGDTVYTDTDGNTYLNPDNPSAYKYIRDIIKELNSYGVTVFVLSGCLLPEEIAADYDDGFETLAAKLSADIGGIRLLESVDVSIRGMDAESGDINADGIRHDIQAFPPLGANQVYRIATSLAQDAVRTELETEGITRYLLTD